MGANPAGCVGSRRSAVSNRSGCDPCRYRFTPFGQSIPRLKGKSSQGSNPITSLPFTFSWTPHCCPQKQQCVFTSRSGSSLELSRTFPDRWGPKAWVILRSSTGTVAKSLPRGPERALREPEKDSPAARTDVLVVLQRARKLVAEPEVALDRNQIAHHGQRGKGGAATGALRLLGPLAGVLVEADSELGGTLEDVEELPERKPEEGDDDRHGMEDGEERIRVALHPRVAHRQHEPRHADGEEQHERQDVLPELLHSRGAVVDHPAPERQHHPSDDQDRSPHERVEDDEGERGIDGERSRRQPEHESPVGLGVARNGLEMDHPHTSGKVTAPARTHPHMIDQCAAPRRRPLRKMKRFPANSTTARRTICRRFPVRNRPSKNTCHPRFQYSFVGGRCSHIVYR